MITLGYAPPKNDLARSLLIGSEQEKLSALRKGSKASRRKCLTLILDLLKNTHSPKVRNVAALAVADLRLKRVKATLVDLLTRSDTKKSRGTLLFVLGELDASIPIDVLTEIIVTSRYEAREEALRFFACEKFEWTPKELVRCTNRLERLTTSPNADRSRSAKSALNYVRKRGQAAAKEK